MMKKIFIPLFTLAIAMSGNSAMAAPEINFETCKTDALEARNSCFVKAKSNFNIAKIFCNRHPNSAECKLQNSKTLKNDKRACRSNHRIVMGLCRIFKD